MKKQITLAVAAFISCIACRPKPVETHSSDCYAYTKNRDTVLLSIRTEQNKITGKLDYHLYEKDRNDGTVTGELSGDTLLLNYSFQSEGMKSSREVAFLKKGNTLIEGYADVEEKKDGTMAFKNRSELKFGSSSITLTKTDCKPH